MAETDQTQMLIDTEAPGTNLSRRTLLAGIGGAVSLAAACSTQAIGQVAEAEDEEEVFNSWERTKSYTNNEMDSGTPWVAPKLGNFDLTDPYDANLARIKIMNNLIGERSYCAMILRSNIGGETNPGAVLYGGFALFSWQMQAIDPEEFPGLPEGTAIQRAQYTCVYVDPQTMEPAEQVLNPLNGKMMRMEDYMVVEQFLWVPMGGGGFVEEPEMMNDDPNTPKMPHVRAWGEEVVLTGDGIYRNPGTHQPRFTSAMWRSGKGHIMDPDRHLESAIYPHGSASKAYEKPWTGYTPDDEIIMTTLASGMKCHTVDDIPDTHKRLILEKYPDRI